MKSQNLETKGFSIEADGQGVGLRSIPGSGHHVSEIAAEIWALHAEGLRLQATSSNSEQIITWCQQAHDCLRNLVTHEHALIEFWQTSLLPFFMASSFLSRCRTKPRGYAGDYLSIQMMYDAKPDGQGAFGVAVDAWALAQPCPRAVRNRRNLVDTLIRELRKKSFADTLSIVSLGSGPAAEVFDCLDFSDTRFTLVDIDQEAIAYVQQKIQLNALAGRVQPVLGNIIKIVLGRCDLIKDGQHAFYSLGLIDYFDDDLVVRLLDYMHSKLETGGVGILGNFKPGHPNEAFFQHALDWPLTLRSSEQLLDLVERSRFRRCLVTVGCEAEGVQLFVKCVKD